MTVTVYTKARAHGAILTVGHIAEGEVGHVTTDHQEIVLAGWEEREIHLEEGYQLTVRQGTAELMQGLADKAAAATAEEPPPAQVLNPQEELPPVIEEEKIADDTKNRSGRR